ncbi:MAG: PEGA domain-containing protein [Deltaproteobacteria bacterium]|nr:PEGA domain-containing protein [Deltaproteobacteria bacterium]
MKRCPRLLKALLLLSITIPFTSTVAGQDKGGEQPTLAILGIKALGVDKSTQRILVRQLNAEIGKLGKFRVVPYREYRSKLEMTNERVLAVCGVKVACYVNAGRMMGVNKLVIGIISRLGKSRTINLKLIDIGDGVLENDVSETVIGKSEKLITAITQLARTLIEFVDELKISIENVNDAVVTIDGKEVGKGADVMVKNTRVGKHSLQVTRPGYSAHTQFFSISFGDRKKITVALKPVDGFLSIVSNAPDATILVDGNKMGTAPMKELIVSPGRHTIRLEHRYFTASEKVVDIKAGTHQRLTFNLKKLKGSLEVTSVPDGASVTIKGEGLGETPLNKEIEAGRYKIGLAKDGFEPQEKEIEVLPEGVNRFEFKLTPLGTAKQGEEEINARPEIPEKAMPEAPKEPGKQPSLKTAWYEKWWVWTAAAATVAVVAVAVAVPLSMQEGGTNLPSFDTKVKLP